MGELKDPQSKSSEDKAAEFHAFIADIAQMKREDAGRGLLARLVEVSPSELTEEDAKIYRSARELTITNEELEAHRKKLIDEDGSQREGIPQSRFLFLEFIENLAIPILLRKRREEQGKREKDKRKKR